MITLKEIGIVHSVFKEKFGTPRQPGLAPSTKAIIELYEPYNEINASYKLNEFSHIWVLFIFNQNIRDKWSPTVRPPRLGGNTEVGVWASRSSFRPNPIGFSVVKLDKIEHINNKVFIHISNIDLVDKTPVIDIKPYLKYSDSIPNAVSGYVEDITTQKLNVYFEQEALSSIKDDISIKNILEECLSNDPRPAYKTTNIDNKLYGIKIDKYEVKFLVRDNSIIVSNITLI